MVFIPIKKKAIIKQLSEIVLEKSDDLVDTANIVLRVTSRIIKKSGMIIAIYNSSILEERAAKFGPYMLSVLI